MLWGNLYNGKALSLQQLETEQDVQHSTHLILDPHS